MRISRVETFRVAPRWLFVRIETDAGVVGWGEASLEGHSDAVRTVVAQFAEQFVHRDAQGLALDVPQCLVDTGHGTAKNRTTAVEAAFRQDLPVVFDARGVATDEVLGELCNDRAYGIRVPLKARLAPADNTGVGLDPYEQPPRGHQERLDPANSHGRHFFRRSWS